MKNSSEPGKPAKPEPVDLPDWTGADRGAARLSDVMAFGLIERYLLDWPETASRMGKSRRAPCPVEFVLQEDEPGH